ncbi:MAG: gamma-glutamyltransferase family protein [Oceanipulchritudo sp.]
MSGRHIIAAGHPLTAEAGLHALRSGGNAFDGAVAAWLAACLAEPVLTSPGGGGFAMVSPAGGRPLLYDFFAQTPRDPNPKAHAYPMEADFGSTRQVFHLGAGSVATPGCVAGILKLHADFGRLPLAECAAPALDLSCSGLVITSHAATLMRVVSALYLSTPEARAVFESPGRPGQCLQEKERFRNRDFEAFLEMLIREGARWFYEGDIGRIVSEYCRDHNGHLARGDFARYRVEVREALEIRRKGSTVWLNPPPSMGGTLIALGLLTRGPGPFAPYPCRETADWREWVEPLRWMSLLRSHDGWPCLCAGDRQSIRTARAANPALDAAMASLFPGLPGQVRTTGTTQISVMDADGNAVSMTTSNGAGSGIIPAGTGFMLNNMLGEEDLQPEGLGTWKPDTRLASMMAPTLARLADGRWVVTGSGGSNRIRSTLLQILRHLLDHGRLLEEAVEAPRLHWENDQLHAEESAWEQLEKAAPALPWPLVRHSVPNLFFGGAHSVARLPDGGFSGMGDPRRGGIVLSA